MKKTLLAILISLSPFFAQTQAQITAGVQAKLSGHQLSKPSRDYETSFKPGFEFGAFSRIGISRIFYFQPELGFSYIGGGISPETGNSVDYECAAFTVPLLFGVTLVEASEANFRFYVGLGNTIPVLDNISVMNETLSEYPNIQVPNKVKSSVYEISGLIGVGFDMLDVTIDLRYGRTFNYTVTRNGDDFYQNTFSIAIGYKMIKP